MLANHNIFKTECVILKLSRTRGDFLGDDGAVMDAQWRSRVQGKGETAMRQRERDRTESAIKTARQIQTKKDV